MKSIFISGGCGGFGLAVARIFRNEGYIVGLGDLRPPADDSILGDGITFYELDVTKPESWDAALSEFTKLTGGRLDILDNNAGIIDSVTIAESEPARIRAVIDVNALGVTLGARAAYPYLKKTPGSQLINIASFAGCYGIPDVGVYAATKAYVQSMTETLDLEWRRDKIRVLDINPPMGKDTHLRRQVQNGHTPRRKPHARRRRASHLARRQPQEPLGQRPPPLGRRRPRQSSPRSPQHGARPRSQGHLPSAVNLVIETIRDSVGKFFDHQSIEQTI